MKRLTIANALDELRQKDRIFTELFSHGTLAIEMYKPKKVDQQQAHNRDEIYVIACGSSDFINDGVRQPVEVGEVLFVPANIEHKFVDFSADFAAWVFFYGPEGGETA